MKIGPIVDFYSFLIDDQHQLIIMASVGSSASALSGQSSTVDYRVFERLQRDSQEVDIALDQFMKERAAALDVQLRGKLDYEAEMRRLDEGIIDEEKTMRNVPNVDHNIMRHLNRDMPGDGDDGGEYDDDGGFEDGDEEDYTNFERYNSAPQFSVYAEAKKPMPSFEEKAALRDKIFSFLDEARLQELDLEMQYTDLREHIEANAQGTNQLNVGGGGLVTASADVATPPTFTGPGGRTGYIANSQDPDNINYGFRIQPEEARANALQDRLSDLQLRHNDELKSMFGEYQVNPFGKAWGNDPDYITLSNRLRELMMSGEKITSAKLLSDKTPRRKSVGAAVAGGASEGEKKKKKTKKKKGKKAAASAADV